MLTFGNTYLNFGGGYIANWRGNTNPLNLPPYTIRLKFKDGITPTFGIGVGTQVSQTPNIWDLTYENNDWTRLLYHQTDLLEVLGANTTNVTSMQQTFSYCVSLTSVPYIDTSNVTNMNSTFAFAYALKNVPKFDTSNVTSMAGMFSNGGLSSIPSFDTYKVENMITTFYNCPITELPSLNTSSVTSMAGMCGECHSLRTVQPIDTSNVTSMNSIFSNCKSLTSVPLFNTTNVVNMMRSFYWCSALQEIPLFDTSNVNNMDETFMCCFNVKSGALALYQQASTQAIPPSSHNGTFDSCGGYTQTGSAELAQIPSDWK